MSTSARTRWLMLAVVLAACVPYLPTIDDYFTQDDFGVVQLLAGKPWTTFPRWFTMPWMEDIWAYTPDEIRPFVALSYQITALAGAERPELHHLFNILLHACNALLVAAIARAAGKLTAVAAAIAGVTFALLPVDAESVAWITGRVDSMPAFFYFATFLCYVQWRLGSTVPWPVRRHGGPLAPITWYFAALAIFFLALFSKQNTITMVATLASWDLMVAPRPVRGSWRRMIAAWLPFTVMTLGYLALRRALFGASLRGGVQSSDQIGAALEAIARHLLRTMFGHAGTGAGWELAVAALLVVSLVVLVSRTRGGLGRVLCLGVAWWIIGAAPVLVAGYESPRHVYLAAAGWAFAVGMAFDAMRAPAEARAAPWRRALPVMLAAAIVTVYAVQLAATVAAWGSWARVSKMAVRGVAREAATVPQGTMLLVSVPRKSWEWAAPFVLRPPYARRDLSGRVVLITPMRLHCCGPSHWESYTRARLREWNERGAGTPIVGLHFAPETGKTSRLSDAERPELRAIVAAFAGTDSWQSLDQAIIDLLEQVVRR